jgi:hypothetical protein
MTLHPMILLLFMLSCTGVLIVGVTSFRERERIPGLFSGVCVCLSECVLLILDVAPASPTTSTPTGRRGQARVTFVVKKVKWGKDKTEKQKRWPRVRPSFSLSGVSNFPCSAEILWVLRFWPLHLLVQYVVAMLRPMCLCAVEDGLCVCPNLHREGVR